MKLVFCSASCVSFCGVFFVDSDFSRFHAISSFCGFTCFRPASKHVFWTTKVFYAFFQGWRQRHGLPELDLNTKQQQLVSWRNAGVSRWILLAFCCSRWCFSCHGKMWAWDFLVFSGGKCTQKYPLKGKLMSKKQILNWLEFEKIRTKIPHKAWIISISWWNKKSSPLKRSKSKISFFGKIPKLDPWCNLFLLDQP